MEDQILVLILTTLGSLLLGFGTIWKLFIGPLLKYKKESEDWKRDVEKHLDDVKDKVDHLESTIPKDIQIVENQMNTKLERYEQLYSRFTHIESVLTEIKIALARVEERISNDPKG